jgi:hypothetical protein
MSNFITGIDDFGTMSGISQGWTFVSFDEVFYNDFQSNAQDILIKSKLGCFHAKKFKRNKQSYYKEFLQLIKDTLSKGDNSIACATLLDQTWKSEFRGFTERVIKGAFEQAGLKDTVLISASQFLASPIFTYLRIASSHISANTTTIHIDHHSITRGLSDINLVIADRKISPQLPIIAALNEYRRKQFPNAPEIERNSIAVLSDDASFIIQAADVVGNFSSALVFKALGKSSKSNDLKAEIMNDVFGDILDTSNITELVEIRGEDFALKASGSFSFSVC